MSTGNLFFSSTGDDLAAMGAGGRDLPGEVVGADTRVRPYVVALPYGLAPFSASNDPAWRTLQSTRMIARTNT
jgi:hypothetical protein